MLLPYCSVASNRIGANSITSLNTVSFWKTSHDPYPLSSTHTFAPGKILLAYGKSTISLACATRIVCSVNPTPMPLATVRLLVNENAIFTVVRFRTDNTSYTPLISMSKNLMINLSPASNPCCALKMTLLVPFKLSQTCCIFPGTDTA